MSRPPIHFGSGADAEHQLSRIAQVRAMVGGLAGASDAPAAPRNIAPRYDAAPPVVQRRFDALADETAAWAATGIRALVAAGQAPAAAAALHVELRRAEARLTALLA